MNESKWPWTITVVNFVETETISVLVIAQFVMNLPSKTIEGEADSDRDYQSQRVQKWAYFKDVLHSLEP